MLTTNNPKNRPTEAKTLHIKLLRVQQDDDKSLHGQFGFVNFDIRNGNVE